MTSLNWRNLVRLDDRQLARIDIAVLNLACAVGLPGLETIDFAGCLSTLDDWAGRCARFTEYAMPMFRSGNSDYQDSEPRFRIQAMITHLQRDLKVQFRPDKRSRDVPLEPADSFLYGIIRGKGGTCASLPVLYAAIGRRLGYPIMLATTKGHVYARWDALPGGECFNIEGSGEGISFFPDEYYRTGQFDVPEKFVQAFGYLQSLSPREELASFLMERAHHGIQAKLFREAVIALAWANELDPKRVQYGYLAADALHSWDEQLRSRLPGKFPKLDIGLPASQFVHMRREAEREIIRMEVMERLLNDPEYDRLWWKPIRENRDVRPHGMPDTLSVNFSWN